MTPLYDDTGEHYDPRHEDQIVRLVKRPILIKKEWAEGVGFFADCGRPPLGQIKHLLCGCLTQIKARPEWNKVISHNGDVHEKLTASIAGDPDLPEHGDLIKPHHLRLFAHYFSRVERVM